MAIDRGSGGAGVATTVTPDDGVFLVGDGTAFVGESGATARASMGLAVIEAAITVPTSGDVLVGNGTVWEIQNGATARTSLGVAIGSDVQAWDAILDDLSGLTQAANKIPYFDSATTAAVLDFLDEDTMASDSATAVASQQSVKAYADTKSTPGFVIAMVLALGG